MVRVAFARALLALGTALAMGACTDPGVDDHFWSCSKKQDCLPGHRCADGVCLPIGSDPGADASGEDAAPADIAEVDTPEVGAATDAGGP